MMMLNHCTQTIRNVTGTRKTNRKRSTSEECSQTSFSNNRDLFFNGTEKGGEFKELLLGQLLSSN